MENQQQINAYASQQEVIYNSRDIDARALLICAGQMQVFVDDQSTDFKTYGDALRRNQKLWTIFQVALSDPDNQLPSETKKILLSLSRYIDKTSFEAMTSIDKKRLKSLIIINRTIASGLAVKVEEPVGAQPQSLQVTPTPATQGAFAVNTTA